MKKFLMLVCLVALPIMVSAEKGAIVAYHQSWRGAPTGAQLEKITHLMLFQVLPLNDGSLDRDPLSASWLTKNWVTNARNNYNVKICVAVGGWQNGVSPSSPNWVSATSDANRTNFVNNIVSLVNEFGFDGIDIDWEYPQNTSGWNQYMKLCNELREKLPGKRLSSALPGATPSGYYDNVVKNGIMNALDAIHLMAYDMEYDWGNHADLTQSKKLIDDWAAWTLGTTGYSKEKLFLGVPFYAKSSWKAWNEFGTQALFNQDNNGSDTYNGAPTLKNKTEHCYNNGYGGIMIWELGHDFAPDNQLSLLKVIYDATEAKGGYTGGGITQHTITASAGSGGTISPNGAVKVNEGASQTFTFAPASGKMIEDVKVNGSSIGVKQSYTFSNVTTDATIAVSFKDDDGSVPKTPDLADGTYEWEADIDEFNLGSSAAVTANTNANLQFNMKNGTSDGDNNKWTWTSVSCYQGGDWSDFTGVTITYTSNIDMELKLLNSDSWSSEDGRSYFVVLPAKPSGTTVTVTPNQFVRLDTDWETEISFDQSHISTMEGVSFSPIGENTQLNVKITSLLLNGLIYESNPCEICENDPCTCDDTQEPCEICENDPCTCDEAAISKNNMRSKVMTAGIINGTLNLTLPSTAKNATVVLFDIRGRMLMKQQISINSGVASIALPKNIAQNQAAILQVKTNSGVNLTKRVLIK